MLVEHPTSLEKQQLTPEQKKNPEDNNLPSTIFQAHWKIVVIQLYIPVVNVEFITYNPSESELAFVTPFVSVGFL